MTTIHFFSNHFSKYFIGLFILVTTSQIAWAQEKQKVFLTDLILAAIEDKRDTVFSNLEISMENINAKDNNYQVILNQDTLESEWNYLPLGDWLKTMHPDKIEIKDGNVVIPKKMEFEYCTFTSNGSFIGLHFNSDLSFYQCVIMEYFVASSSNFQNLFFDYNQLKDLIITKNSFEKRIEFYYDEISGNLGFEQNTIQSNFTLLLDSFEKDLSISNNTFLENKNSNNIVPVTNDSLFYGRTWKIWQRLHLEITTPSNSFEFKDNKSESHNDGDFYFILVNFSNMYFYDNLIHGVLNLGGSAEKFDFEDNKIQYVSFRDFSFSEQNNKMDWEDFKDSKLAVVNYPTSINIDKNGFDNMDFKDVGIPDSASMKLFAEQSDGLMTFYLGENKLEMADRGNYNGLFRSFYRLHAAFKAEGDIESANACYIEMKNLETRRLKYIFTDAGGFDNFFRWQLNTLLKSYTDYGTNPAKAVRMSFYIIFIFGIFYFFFPSEWDKESKKNMLLDFQKFIKKNDHGYVKPFFTLCLGVLLSLINGMMLSLNAFVTLGFGKIPTKGFPRYVCIIQGFIGWFLLSIFTVALINQVLF